MYLQLEPRRLIPIIAIYLQPEPRRLILELCRLLLKPPKLWIVHQSLYGKPPWPHGVSLMF
jgi:hypothetical protein